MRPLCDDSDTTTHALRIGSISQSVNPVSLSDALAERTVRVHNWTTDTRSLTEPSRLLAPSPRAQEVPMTASPQVRTNVSNVLVIGTGAAGLRAAIAAHSAGCEVMVVGKRACKDAHSVLASGGIDAVPGKRPAGQLATAFRRHDAGGLLPQRPTRGRVDGRERPQSRCRVGWMGLRIRRVRPTAAWIRGSLVRIHFVALATRATSQVEQ